MSPTGLGLLVLLAKPEPPPPDGSYPRRDVDAFFLDFAAVLRKCFRGRMALILKHLFLIKNFYI